MFNFLFFKNTNYSFEGKKDGEEVVVFLHRHWFTLVSKIASLIFGALLPLFVLLVLGQVIITYSMIPLFAFLSSLYYLVLWYMFFYFLTMYTLDVWIVTNMRIIDSKQHGFFSRTVAELSLGNIQDVSTDVEGAISTMINYGNVEVQTAGNDNHFLFEQIPNPQNVKSEIMRLATDYKTAHGMIHL